MKLKLQESWSSWYGRSLSPALRSFPAGSSLSLKARALRRKQSRASTLHSPAAVERFHAAWKLGWVGKRSIHSLGKIGLDSLASVRSSIAQDTTYKKAQRFRDCVLKETGGMGAVARAAVFFAWGLSVTSTPIITTSDSGVWTRMRYVLSHH